VQIGKVKKGKGEKVKKLKDEAVKIEKRV